MRHPARRPAALLAALAAAHVVEAALPSVDFERMGKVGLAGSFAGLDLLVQDAAESPFAGVPLDPSTSTLFSRSAEGGLTRLGSTNQGGAIRAGCALDDTFFFAGTFDSFQGTQAKNIASYSPSTGLFNALGGSGAGVDGPVNAVYCDDKNKLVWVGGSFDAPTTGGDYVGAVALFSPKSNSWSAPAFGGLQGGSGAVWSISPNPAASSLYFTGSFLAAFDGNGTQININGTGNPSVPISSGASTFSRSLVPIDISGANITAGPPSPRADFSDIFNILCPKGDDGPDNTWLARDGAGAQITIRNFKFMSTHGLRLGQTAVEGRGTQTFCVRSIPDNEDLTMRYIDPATGEEQTCKDACPLASNSGVPYQDYLYADGPRDVTGVQITLRGYSGDGPGLHLMQLLSDGAYASAVPDQNAASCYAPGSSGVDVTGDWATQNVPTDIAGTTQEIRTQNVRVGTPAGRAPSVTWNVYVSAPGNYDVFLLVPGCTQMQDCASRTSVKVTVSPGAGIEDHVETVSQQNPSDARLQVYSGPVLPVGPDYLIKVTMTLADSPEGTGAAGQYHLVADRVQFVLTSDINGGDGSSGGNITVPGKSQQSFGFFEWPLSSTDAAPTDGLLPNSTITAQDYAGFNLTAALGSSAGTAAVRASAQHSSGRLFLAGNFTLTGGARNVVAFDGTALVPLNGNGVNGGVAALAIDNDTLFLGGAFTDTATASGGSTYSNVVKFNVASNEWQPLGSGLDGAVHSLVLLNGKLYVTGQFSHILGTNQPVGGLAVWDVAKNAWVPSGGLLVGSMSVVAPGTTDIPTFVAGNAIRSAQFGADGFVMLENGKNGQPVLKPLGVSLDQPAPAAPSPTPEATAPTRRAWMSLVPSIFARQSQQPAALPGSPATPAPAVLAGAFWTNSSSSTQLAIFGGNFTYPGGTGVALYDADKAVLSSLQGATVDGTVLSLLVVGDLLFIGGEFAVDGANGFAIYDLSAQAWQTNVPALQGTSVLVRSLTQIPAQEDVVVVAGTFASAGSLPCQSLCTWNIKTKQWSSLGSGIRGEVSTVVYAGNKLNTMLVGGSIQLADNTASNVAAFSVSNSTWSAVGGGQNIPGPVTALEVNNGNASSVFAAGKSTDGATTFLIRYDGATWQPIDLPLSADSSVAQLAMVPLTDEHAENSVIQKDRMLWLSGALSSTQFGNASSVLYDGASFYPYLAATRADGSPGYVASMFRSFKTFSFNQRKFLATGIVILISIAIAAGIVFLLALIGILWTLFARRDDNLNGYPVEDDDSSSMHHPSSLLAHINEATRKTILGGDHDDPFHGGEKVAAAGMVAGAMHDSEDYHDDDGYRRAETPAVGGVYADDSNRPAHARYSFEGSGPGELAVSAGAELIVLDDRDPAWWFVRDVTTGREGVVPAAYII